MKPAPQASADVAGLDPDPGRAGDLHAVLIERGHAVCGEGVGEGDPAAALQRGPLFTFFSVDQLPVAIAVR